MGIRILLVPQSKAMLRSPELQRKSPLARSAVPDATAPGTTRAPEKLRGPRRCCDASGDQLIGATWSVVDSVVSAGMRTLPLRADFGHPRGRPRSNGPAMYCVALPELTLANVTSSSGSTRGSAQTSPSIVNDEVIGCQLPTLVPVQLTPQPGCSPLQENASVARTSLVAGSVQKTSVSKAVTALSGMTEKPVMGC